jgi:hypothetical protein
MTVEEAKEHGRSAGIAINQSDQARYKFHADWFRRAIAGASNKAELQTAWNDGYKQERDADIKFRNISARW